MQMVISVTFTWYLSMVKEDDVLQGYKTPRGAPAAEKVELTLATALFTDSDWLCLCGQRLQRQLLLFVSPEVTKSTYWSELWYDSSCIWKLASNGNGAAREQLGESMFETVLGARARI